MIVETDTDALRAVIPRVGPMLTVRSLSGWRAYTIRQEGMVQSGKSAGINPEEYGNRMRIGVSGPP